MMYLRTKGVSPDDITKALAGVAQAGRYLIEYEALSPPLLSWWCRSHRSSGYA